MPIIKRNNRINDFDHFRNNAQDIFAEFAKNDRSNERLHNLFSLCICPGGRDGGLNEKIVEVFYGNRPIGKTTQVNNNFQTITRLETAHGATLAYFRTDNGHVICNLYPAKSENQKPYEEIILLDYIKSPSLLTKRAKTHWNMFISYMEATCIDGEPSLLQILMVFYLKNFKQCVVNKTVQDKRVTTLFKEISKYVLTIGLSGFLILVFNLYKEGIDDRKVRSKYEELTSAVEKISNTSSEVSSNTKNINESLQIIADIQKQNNKDIQQIINNTRELNAVLSEAISNIRKISSDLEDIITKNSKISNLSKKKNTLRQ